MDLFFYNTKNQLFNAVKNGDNEVVKKLFDGGGGGGGIYVVNSRDEDENTPLHIACRYGHLSIAKLLLDHGAELEAKCGNDQYTPLDLACIKGHNEIIRELLFRRGADRYYERRNNSGKTLLHLACMFGHSGVVKTLLDEHGRQGTKNININAEDNGGETPLISASKRGHSYVVKTLLDNGANIEAKTKGGRTPLHWACVNSHVDVVKELLKRGANANAKTDDGWTPYGYARTDEIQKLILKNNPSGHGSPLPRKTTLFYEELFRKQENGNQNNMLQNKLEKLSPSVGDVHEMKLLYTMVMHCFRQKYIDFQFCKKCIKAGLVKTAETCATEDALVTYKIILKKVSKDNIISESEKKRFKNRAEVKRMSEADFIKDMKKAIEANTQRIENLEHRADEMQKVIYSVIEHIKYRRKVEAAMGVMTCIINAFSLGVGGSLLETFATLTCDIVDFGDIQHINEQIGALVECDGTTAGHELKDQFLEGIEMAEVAKAGVKMVGGQFINQDVNRVLLAMTALGQAAALASFTPTVVHHSFPTGSRVVVHGIISAPKLNGKIGYVHSELIDGRQNILVDGYLKPVSLSVSNLKLLLQKENFPASQTTSFYLSFPVGSHVIVHGVVSTPKLNGKVGYVQSKLMDGRHIVLVDGCTPVSLDASNLRLFPENVSPVSPPSAFDIDSEGSESTGSGKNDNNNQSPTTAASQIFLDAALSKEDEERFLLHCAVKYGDMECIKEEVAFLPKNDINVCDSQGRTALDLAALTGQLEVMKLISKHGGDFRCGPRPKMKAMANRRSLKMDQYLKQVQKSLDKSAYL